MRLLVGVLDRQHLGIGLPALAEALAEAAE